VLIAVDVDRADTSHAADQSAYQCSFSASRNRADHCAGAGANPAAQFGVTCSASGFNAALFVDCLDIL
jgi:hypothetical protein